MLPTLKKNLNIFSNLNVILKILTNRSVEYDCDAWCYCKVMFWSAKQGIVDTKVAVDCRRMKGRRDVSSRYVGRCIVEHACCAQLVLARLIVLSNPSDLNVHSFKLYYQVHRVNRHLLCTHSPWTILTSLTPAKILTGTRLIAPSSRCAHKSQFVLFSLPVSDAHLFYISSHGLFSPGQDR